MIQDICRYNPLRDIDPVSQTGWINLYEAYATHTIPTVIDNVDVAYNEIENPSSIMGKPHDVFEATRMASYINETGRKENAPSQSSNSGESVVPDA